MTAFSIQFILIGTNVITFIIALSYIFFLRKSNLILILICIELIFISINMLFIIFSILLDDLIGYFFSFFILSISAAESAIGLAILIIFYRLKQTISVDFLTVVKS